MTFANEIKNNGYITCVLNIMLLTKQQEKICLFMFVLKIKLFPKNIQNNFTLTLPFTKIEITKAAVNYIRQYKLNFSQVEESKITSWQRADNALHLKNTKGIFFVALLSHAMFKH